MSSKTLANHYWAIGLLTKKEAVDFYKTRLAIENIRLLYSFEKKPGIVDKYQALECSRF